MLVSLVQIPVTARSSPLSFVSVCACVRETKSEVGREAQRDTLWERLSEGVFRCMYEEKCQPSIPHEYQAIGQLE